MCDQSYVTTTRIQTNKNSLIWKNIGGIFELVTDKRIYVQRWNNLHLNERLTKLKSRLKTENKYFT
jgi:hypothetical protein